MSSRVRGVERRKDEKKGRLRTHQSTRTLLPSSGRLYTPISHPSTAHFFTRTCFAAFKQAQMTTTPSVQSIRTLRKSVTHQKDGERTGMSGHTSEGRRGEGKANDVQSEQGLTPSGGEGSIPPGPIKLPVAAPTAPPTTSTAFAPAVIDPLLPADRVGGPLVGKLEMARLARWTNAWPMNCLLVSSMKIRQCLFGCSIERLTTSEARTRTSIRAWTTRARGPRRAQWPCAGGGGSRAGRRWEEDEPIPRADEGEGSQATSGGKGGAIEGEEMLSILLVGVAEARGVEARARPSLLLLHGPPLLWLMTRLPIWSAADRHPLTRLT